MSMNPEVDGDVLALIGASAALSLSGAPFGGPIGAAKVGYKDGQYLLNPTKAELVDSKLDLVVAGTANAVLMVESEAQELSEDVMLGAVMFGHQQMRVAINTINELVAEAGKPKWTWAAPAADANMVAALKTAIGDRLNEAFSVTAQLERKAAISVLKKDVIAALSEQNETNGWNPATSRCGSRSTRSMNWLPRPASRSGPGPPRPPTPTWSPRSRPPLAIA